MGNVLFVYITGGSAGGKGHRSEAGAGRPCGGREISHREICGKFPHDKRCTKMQLSVASDEATQTDGNELRRFTDILQNKCKSCHLICCARLVLLHQRVNPMNRDQNNTARNGLVHHQTE